MSNVQKKVKTAEMTKKPTNLCGIFDGLWLKKNNYLATTIIVFSLYLCNLMELHFLLFSNYFEMYVNEKLT